MSKGIEYAIKKYLRDRDVIVDREYNGQDTSTEWKSDKWKIIVASKKSAMNFEFKTGLGLRDHGNPTRPSSASILHSCLLDADSGNMDFKEFCAEHGYSDDSIKALACYHACVKMHDDLSKIFTESELNDLREMLQDY